MPRDSTPFVGIQRHHVGLRRAHRHRLVERGLFDRRRPLGRSSVARILPRRVSLVRASARDARRTAGLDGAPTRRVDPTVFDDGTRARFRARPRRATAVSAPREAELRRRDRHRVERMEDRTRTRRARRRMRSRPPGRPRTQRLAPRCARARPRFHRARRRRVRCRDRRGFATTSPPRCPRSPRASAVYP